MRYRTDINGNRIRYKGTPIHNSFSAAKQRCNDKNFKQYKDYGGRGIKVLWNSFFEFYEDMNESHFSGAQIDRIDNNGHYCKENCKWSTPNEQARNKRDSLHTVESVKMIRRLYSDGDFNQVELAEMFNDSQGNISNIITSKTWKL